jgi:hypothetical protein
VGLNLLGVLLALSLGRVEVHDSIAVITAIATTVVVVGVRGLLVVGLLVVVVTARTASFSLQSSVVSSSNSNT